jgi:hypothetical protein
MTPECLFALVRPNCMPCGRSSPAAILQDKASSRMANCGFRAFPSSTWQPAVATVRTLDRLALGVGGFTSLHRSVVVFLSLSACGIITKNSTASACASCSCARAVGTSPVSTPAVCWGSNDFGQCNVPSLAPGLNYTQFACGDAHSWCVENGPSLFGTPTHEHLMCLQRSGVGRLDALLWRQLGVPGGRETRPVHDAGSGTDAYLVDSVRSSMPCPGLTVLFRLVG